MNEETKIELKSPAVNEILGRPPQWIIRWGITVIFIIIGGIIVGSAFFKYPDVITATIAVTTENLPTPLIARTTGKLDTIFISDNQIVEKEKYLAVIENTANLNDVLKLKEILNDFAIQLVMSGTNDKSTFLFSKIFPFLSVPMTLGELQSSYFQFVKSLKDYDYFIKTDFHNQKINAFRRQITIQQTLEKRAKNQINISKEQFETQKRLFSVDSSLFINGVISFVDLENAKNTYLQTQQTYENSLNSVENIQLNIAQFENNILDLQLQADEKSKELLLSLSGAYENLQAQIKQWELQYILKSTVSGKVSLSKQWQQKQHINSGDLFASIIPVGVANIKGIIMLPSQGSGKVKVGQMVNVKFDGFPHMEFGMVRGLVKKISLVPVIVGNEKFTMLEVEFPEQLTTNYGKTLDFSQEMSGIAEIITEDMMLLDRFLNPVKSLVKR